MTTPLFVDTWGWITLRVRREQHHEAAAEFVRASLEEGRHLVTTDYVLDETITLLYKRISAAQAEMSTNQIFRFERRGLLQREPITESRFQAALDLRRRYADKPDISFTDLASMAVMDELDIQDVLTGDAHFEHVGLGFRRRPTPEGSPR